MRRCASSIGLMSTTKSSYVRSGDLLSRASSRLLIVDVQEKLLPAIPARDHLIANCGRLIEGAKILDVPVFVTEQYPQGLGQTTPVLAKRLGTAAAKVRFSCAEVLDWGMAAEQTDQRFQVVVAGMEAH